MVCKPPKQYIFELSDEEKKEIYNAVVENDLLNIKDDFTNNCDMAGNCIDITPLVTSTLKINMNKKEKTIKYAANYFNENDAELKKLENVLETINKIIDEKEKVLEVEQPECAYF